MTKEGLYDIAFRLGLIGKALFSAIEIIGGFFALIIGHYTLLKLMLYVTQDELSEDPNDVLAQTLVGSAHYFSISTQYFTALYLLSHGLVKALLVLGLLKKKAWCYPLAAVVFGFFVAFRLFRYSHTHSLWLLAITGMDLMIIALVLHAYWHLRHPVRNAA